MTVSERLRTVDRANYVLRTAEKMNPREARRAMPAIKAAMDDILREANGVAVLPAGSKVLSLDRYYREHRAPAGYVPTYAEADVEFSLAWHRREWERKQMELVAHVR